MSYLYCAELKLDLEVYRCMIKTEWTYSNLNLSWNMCNKLDIFISVFTSVPSAFTVYVSMHDFQMEKLFWSNTLSKTFLLIRYQQILFGIRSCHSLPSFTKTHIHSTNDIFRSSQRFLNHITCWVIIIIVQFYAKQPCPAFEGCVHICLTIWDNLLLCNLDLDDNSIFHYWKIWQYSADLQ